MKKTRMEVVIVLLVSVLAVRGMQGNRIVSSPEVNDNASDRKDWNETEVHACSLKYIIAISITTT